MGLPNGGSKIANSCRRSVFPASFAVTVYMADFDDLLSWAEHHCPIETK